MWNFWNFFAAAVEYLALQLSFHVVEERKFSLSANIFVLFFEQKNRLLIFSGHFRLWPEVKILLEN